MQSASNLDAPRVLEDRLEWKWNCRGLQQDEAGPLKRDLHDTQGLFKACRSALLSRKPYGEIKTDAFVVNKTWSSFVARDRAELTIIRQHLTVGHCRIQRLSIPEVLDVAPSRRNHYQWFMYRQLISPNMRLQPKSELLTGENPSEVPA